MTVEHRNFEIGDLVSWGGHVTGLEEMTRVFGVITHADEGGYDIDTPAVITRGDGVFVINTVSRRYGKALFGRLNPRIMRKHASRSTARLGA